MKSPEELRRTVLEMTRIIVESPEENREILTVKLVDDLLEETGRPPGRIDSLRIRLDQFAPTLRNYISLVLGSAMSGTIIWLLIRGYADHRLNDVVGIAMASAVSGFAGRMSHRLL